MVFEHCWMSNMRPLPPEWVRRKRPSMIACHPLLPVCFSPPFNGITDSGTRTTLGNWPESARRPYSTLREQRVCVLVQLGFRRLRWNIFRTKCLKNWISHQMDH
uniref:(northern house mosquito) hypothetical protein n=1 Tax=Culex pipiens TaxID=7175 RepID=A0A8D8ERP8_CULPI